MADGFRGKNPPSRGNDKLADLLPVYEFKENDNTEVSFRPFGTIISYEFYWFHIITTKGISKVPKLCTDLDPWTDEYIEEKCPFRADGRGQASRVYLVNAIDRDRQLKIPRNLPTLNSIEDQFVPSDYFDAYAPFNFDGSMRFIKKGSKAFTIWRPLVLSAASVRQIGEGEENNIVNGEKYSCTHPEYGFDVQFKYNSKGTGTGKMIVTADPKDERNLTAITDEELEFPVYELDVMKYPRLKDHKNDYKEFSQKITDAPDETKKGGATARGRLEEDERDDDVRNAPRRGARGNTDKLGAPAGRRGRVEEDDSDIPF